MVGSIHALLLLSLPMAVGFALVRSFRWPTWAAVGWTAAILLAMALVGGFAIHMCMLGQPVAQWLLPSACGSVAVLFVDSRALRRGLAVTSILLCAVLTQHYTAEVHGPTYVGTQVGRFAGHTRREWHSWITGLYRRTGPPVDRTGR
jgi:hypothetical protein